MPVSKPSVAVADLLGKVTLVIVTSLTVTAPVTDVLSVNGFAVMSVTVPILYSPAFVPARVYLTSTGLAVSTSLAFEPEALSRNLAEVIVGVIVSPVTVLVTVTLILSLLVV